MIETVLPYKTVQERKKHAQPGTVWLQRHDCLARLTVFNQNLIILTEKNVDRVA